MSSKHARIRAKRHAITRARERYDVCLEFADVEMMSWAIRHRLGRTRYVNYESGRSVVLVTALCGTTMASVFAHRLGTIITFLPMNCWEMKYWARHQQPEAA